MGGDLPVYYPFAVPSDRLWFDPAVVGRNLYYQIREVTYTGDGRLQLADANPMRWGILFDASTDTGTPYNVYPGAFPAGDSGYRVRADSPLWFNLFTHGPLPMAPWFGNVPGPGPYRVLEVIRQSHWEPPRV